MSGPTTPAPTGKSAKRARKPRYADPSRARIGRALTLTGHLGLLTLILNWFIWISPPSTVPRAFPIIALAVPLLFPLRGILHGRRYTHQWTSFLSMVYFAVGIDAWANAAAGAAWLGATTVLLSLLLFVGTVVYARYTPSGGPSEAALAEQRVEAALSGAGNGAAAEPSSSGTPPTGRTEADLAGTSVGTTPVAGSGADGTVRTP